jgi:hypothetical protein
MDNNRIPSTETKIKVLNKRPLERPKTRWKDQVREDIHKNGHRYKNSAYGNTERNGEDFALSPSLVETSRNNDDDDSKWFLQLLTCL